MLESQTIDSARIEGGSEFVLARHDQEWIVRVDGRVLMSSRMHDSEEALAEHALERCDDPETVLVGGLGLGFTLRGSCVAAGIPVGPVWGVVSLCACALAGWLAWPIARGESRTDAFVAMMALLAAGLFALAIGYQTLATLILPPCAH